MKNRDKYNSVNNTHIELLRKRFIYLRKRFRVKFDCCHSFLETSFYIYSMKITLCSIGKTHDNNLKVAIEDFSKRITNYFPMEWLIIPTPKTAGLLSSDDLKKAEATVVLQQLNKEDYLVLLDERGKNISSPHLAELLQNRGNESTKRVVFLIGGAFGVDETIFNRANFIWSLSKLVFPHMIVRLLLSEQVYRACSIIRNEKYHHV